jgi:acetoin utilization deacetylase AcuC-like enzyme
MKVVYTLRHRLHHPQREFEASGFQEPLEHPQRAEIIRAALAGDDTFEFTAPDEFGLEPIEAVHDPGLVQFLESAWEECSRWPPCATAWARPASRPTSA